MCTRYYIDKEQEFLRTIAEAVEKSPLYNRFVLEAGKSIKTEGEVFPTDIVPVLAPNKNGKTAAYPMRWGIHMADQTPLFNARSETAGIKPFFKEDWKRRRCIVPASFYYEWAHEAAKPKKTTTPAGQSSWFTPQPSAKKVEAGKYAIQPSGSTVTWLCGLYRFEDGLPYFVILTREPSGDLKRIHDRMPLILPQEKISEWIRPETDPSSLLKYAITDMMLEHAE